MSKELKMPYPYPRAVRRCGGLMMTTGWCGANPRAAACRRTASGGGRPTLPYG